MLPRAVHVAFATIVQMEAIARRMQREELNGSQGSSWTKVWRRRPQLGGEQGVVLRRLGP